MHNYCGPEWMQILRSKEQESVFFASQDFIKIQESDMGELIAEDYIGTLEKYTLCKNLKRGDSLMNPFFLLATKLMPLSCVSCKMRLQSH